MDINVVLLHSCGLLVVGVLMSKFRHLVSGLGRLDGVKLEEDL